VLIDDAPHYASDFALNNRPVILIEQPYNLSIKGDLIYRVKNWTEVKRHISSSLGLKDVVNTETLSENLERDKKT
jgi:uncharacterized HAD superfamily protein